MDKLKKLMCLEWTSECKVACNGLAIAKKPAYDCHVMSRHISKVINVQANT